MNDFSRCAILIFALIALVILAGVARCKKTTRSKNSDPTKK